MTKRSRDCGDQRNALGDCPGGATASSEQTECNAEECEDRELLQGKGNVFILRTFC